MYIGLQRALLVEYRTSKTEKEAKQHEFANCPHIIILATIVNDGKTLLLGRVQFRLKVPKARCHLHSISQATQVHSLNLESGIPGQFWMCPSFSMIVRGILKPSKTTIGKTICSNFLEFRIFEANYVAVVHYANLRRVGRIGGIFQPLMRLKNT